MPTTCSSLAQALSHARLARAARARIALAKASGDIVEVARWERHERANMACFRLDLNEATGR